MAVEYLRGKIGSSHMSRADPDSSTGYDTKITANQEILIGHYISVHASLVRLVRTVERDVKTTRLLILLNWLAIANADGQSRPRSLILLCKYVHQPNSSCLHKPYVFPEKYPEKLG